jgi:hypothetical protein
MAESRSSRPSSSLDPTQLINPPRITWELPAVKGGLPPGRSGHSTNGDLLNGEILLFGGGRARQMLLAMS